MNREVPAIDDASRKEVLSHPAGPAAPRNRLAAPSRRAQEARHMTTDSLKVHCVVDYYLPGFKGGGPLRTIANMRPMLANEPILRAIFLYVY